MGKQGDSPSKKDKQFPASDGPEPVRGEQPGRTRGMPPSLHQDCTPNPSRGDACSLLSDQQWRSITRSLRLSGREFEIVRSIFSDQTEASIALHLGISEHTVHTHLERLYRKLGVSSRCQLVVRIFAEYLSVVSSSGWRAPGPAE